MLVEVGAPWGHPSAELSCSALGIMEIRLAARVIASMSGNESQHQEPLDLASWQTQLSNDITTLAQLVHDDESLPAFEFDPILDGDCRHAAAVSLLAHALGIDEAMALEVGLCAELFHAAAFSNDDLESYRRPFYAAHGGTPLMRQDPRRLVSIGWYRQAWVERLHAGSSNASLDDIFAAPERVALAVRAWCLWAGSAAMARSSLPRLLTIGGRLLASAVRLLPMHTDLRTCVDFEHAVGVGLNLGRLWALERLHAMQRWNVHRQVDASPAEEAEDALFVAMCRREALASAEAALGFAAVMSMPQAVRLTLDEFIKKQRARVLLSLEGNAQIKPQADSAPQNTGLDGLGIENADIPAASRSSTSKERAHVI